MLYKHLFSILCGHLNLNKKRKKIEFDRLPVKPTGKPAGKPVYPADIPVRTVSTGEFEFKFAFVRFRPVTGLTGPVSRNRTLAVRGDRSENLTLATPRTRLAWHALAAIRRWHHVSSKLEHVLNNSGPGKQGGGLGRPRRQWR